MNSTRLLPSVIFCLALIAAIAPAAEPKSAAELGAVPPVAQTTVLTADGGAPLILAPANGAGRVAAEQLRGALRQRLGVEPRLLSRIAEATPGQATVIALGNLLDNELLARLYWSRYCYEDALFPGPNGYTVHTVYDPHPWGGGRNVIVLGASRPEQLGKAVERFLGLLPGEGQATALPYVLIVEPAKKRSDAARAKMLAKPVDPSLTAFRTHAEPYLKTGEETYAQIGDVTFGLGDRNGDGRQEIVHGSSTGDLIAMDLKNKTLWRFDNYGYPVERVRCADLNGDGRPEILIASGTGYMYCLDAQGAPLWQQRLGLAVHDLVLADGLIVAGTQDGEIHALDGSGNLRWTQSVGAGVTKLSAISLEGRSAVVAGLADGRLLALAAE